MAQFICDNTSIVYCIYDCKKFTKLLKFRLLQNFHLDCIYKFFLFLTKIIKN